MKLVKESIADHLKGKDTNQIRADYLRNTNHIIDKAISEYANDEIAPVYEDKENINAIAKFLFDEMGIMFSDFYFDHNSGLFTFGLFSDNDEYEGSFVTLGFAEYEEGQPGLYLQKLDHRGNTVDEMHPTMDEQEIRDFIEENAS